jgi:glycine/D-amino acid oxidase-like deaminating enzyme
MPWTEPFDLSRSLWAATAAPGAAYEALDGDIDADVAIVGLGITGLSTALHLAERGVRVVAVDAATVGFGASGRNGGQVIPGLKENPAELRARWGAQRGDKLVRFVGGAADSVFDLVARHGIACGARRDGWLQAAHRPAALPALQRRAEAWAAEGADVAILDRTATVAATGSDAYVGGFLDRRAGVVQPLDYTRGLARAAEAAGAALYEETPVLAIRREGNGHRLDTPRGRIRAGAVVLAVNAYADGIAAPLDRSIVPVVSLQVATAPMPPEVARSILPGGQAVSDTRRLLSYFRMGPGDRFVMGGRGAYGGPALRGRIQALRRRAVELYPALRDAGWGEAWGGLVAMTPDHLPHLHRPAPGLVAFTGCNGRGVALATALGRMLAEAALGAPDEALDFPVTPVRPIPLHALRRPAVAATVLWYGLRDALDGRIGAG